MRAYRETFRRHRVLYLLPALLAAVIVGAISYKAPTYTSYASLWVDNQAGTPSSLAITGNSQSVTPAGSEETVLTELLATAKFQDAVAAGAGLPRSDASLVGAVTASTPGPQVLRVTTSAPTPADAYKIVKSVVGQLQSFTRQWARQFAGSAVHYFQAQVASATQALHQASGGSSTGIARAALQSDEAALNQAEAQASASDGFATGMVLGQPTTDPVALTGHMKLAEKAIGGFVGGLLLSLLLIAARTPSADDRWEEEPGRISPEFSPGVPASVHLAGSNLVASNLVASNLAAATSHPGPAHQPPAFAGASAPAALGPVGPAGAGEEPARRMLRSGGLLRRRPADAAPAAAAEGGSA